MRYWSPPGSPAGQLLPILARGSRLHRWPESPTVAIDIDVSLVGIPWRIQGTDRIDQLEIVSVTASGAPRGMRDTRLAGHLPLLVTLPSGTTWKATLGVDGIVRPVSGDLAVTRGHLDPIQLSEVLTDWPLTAFFQDGTTTRGSQLFEGRNRAAGMPPISFEALAWGSVNIRAETDRSIRPGEVSIHEHLAQLLETRPRKLKHRWILHNDGHGEISDLLVLEYERGKAHVQLWHAKAAGGNPSVRVTDFEEAAAQAIKSRRWDSGPRPLG